MIYFDNAATTYPKPDCVYDAMNYAMKHYSFNAGRGSYKVAKETFKMIEETRNKIADLVGANGNNVIFTSSATEAMNNIIYGLDLKEGDNVFVSAFEHNAVIRTLHSMKVNLVIIPLSKDSWILEEEKFNDLMVLKHPKAVIISQISNVTGFSLPYEKIFNFSKKHKCINVLDSAQSFGVYPCNTNNVDFVVFTGHKSLYACFGIGGYINVNGCNLKKYKIGGTGSDSLNLDMPAEIPLGYEAGSLNAVGIYSINQSIDFLKREKFMHIKEKLVQYLLNKLSDLDNVEIYLPKNYISKGIVSFNVNGYSADDIGNILSNEYDICVRTGFHCAPLIHDFIGSKKHEGTVRVSFSGFNTIEEIDVLISALKEM